MTTLDAVPFEDRDAYERMEREDPRCPRCGKRLAHDIGQDDTTGSGALIVAYRCDHCDYTTTEMRRPWVTRGARSGGRTLAESLYRMRASQ